ncbi:hypothetical protein GCM10011348_05110 [Marinobacterium nitratireducens]|uniref:Uncharacterized protein n=1 Tax=Marinobacterium nitratireducens TaxID=518897 RepID=A0A917Z715_9GAMM|nr:hypothetical protein GCM10011348_05110 [Marinobacterium nitratireducens]
MGGGALASRLPALRALDAHRHPSMEFMARPVPNEAGAPVMGCAAMDQVRCGEQLPMAAPPILQSVYHLLAGTSGTGLLPRSRLRTDL